MKLTPAAAPATPPVAAAPAAPADDKADDAEADVAAEGEGEATGDDAKKAAEGEAAEGEEKKELTEEEKKKAAEANQKKQDDWLKQQMDTKIKSFTCDRIPSKALKVWATPPKEEKEGEESEDGEVADSSDDNQPAPRRATTTVRIVNGVPVVSTGSGPAAGPAAAAAASPASSEAGVPDKETQAKLKAFEAMLTALQRNISLGEWPEVKSQLGSIAWDDQKAALYLRILSQLAEQSKKGPDLTGVNEQEKMLLQFAMNQQRRGGNRFAETSLISIPDVIGLAEAAPIPLDAEEPEEDKDEVAVADDSEAVKESTEKEPAEESDGSDDKDAKVAKEAEKKKQLAEKKAAEKKLAANSKKAVAGLGRLLQISLQSGNVIDGLVVRLKADPPLMPKRQAALMLSSAGQNFRLGDFLPSVDEAEKADDREALNLLSRYFLAINGREPSVEHLEQAWHVTQAVLAVGEVTDEQKQEAMRRAVELIPQVKEELGTAWMQESFRERPDRGREIVAALGEACGRSFQRHMYDEKQRERLLVMQRTAVDSLVEQVPDQVGEWQGALNLLAQHWLREAQNTLSNDRSSSYGSSMRRDRYGNIYYVNGDGGGLDSYQINSQRNPSPIPAAEVLKNRPEGQWRELLEPGIAAKFDMTASKLFLKVNEPEKAFPYLEQLAVELPEQATELADEFLRVWAKNHNPNAERDRTSFYMFSYGFSRRAERIPLTRSKQNRNLAELADWAARLKKLPIKDWDESLLVSAFTTSHSSAEVYRLDDIEKVFGSIDSLESETLATFAQSMRSNLAQLWRSPKVQKDKNTNRKQKDIEIEVQRGYATAEGMIEKGLNAYPEDWRLQLANACLSYDKIDYANEVQKSGEFAEKRRTAIDAFKAAAATYTEKAGDLAEEDQSVESFEKWFYACLGSPDIGRVDEEAVPLTKRVEEVAAALNALPSHVVESHRTMFANNMFSRLSSVNPSCKFRYLREAFKIVGDHEQAHEAKKVFDYYQDLVTEIEFEAEIDGAANVGEEPFGLLVSINHTQAIERESGGFGRYLQNQNNGYFYNYGRPTENYRDKFEEAAVAALQEHFEVLSVTFNKADANSKAVAKAGWRVTPYAYLLLKARGPEVDKVPSLRLDLDFLDTSGYAILPIETAHLPIDASKQTASDEVPANLEVVQTLDERQASDGRLILEVKASATGLIPQLEQLVDFKPDGFEVADLDDQGVVVTEFDDDSDETAVKSERLWIYTMEADDAEAMPKEFAFADVKPDSATTKFQCFDDADVKEVESTVALERNYPRAKRRWLLPLLAICGLAFLVVAVLLLTRPTVKEAKVLDYAMPEKVTPFTAINLLEQIRSTNGLDSNEKQELSATINRLQSFYFTGDEDAKTNGDTPDLDSLMRDWISKTGR